MAGDDIGAADDDDFVDEPLHQDLAMAIAGGHGVIIGAVAHQ